MTAAPAPSGVTLRSLADLRAHPELLQPPTTVIPRLAWAGRVTLLAGREKDGKSTLAAAGCAALSAAGAERPTFLDQPLDPGLVVWLSADAESPFDQVSRFMRFNAEPQNVWFAQDWDRTPASFLRSVLDTRPAVTVIDTLASFAELAVADAGASAAWTPLMLAIKRAANESGTAIILIHHAAKATGRYRDSTAIGAGVDAILELEPAEDGSPVRRIRARAKWPMDGYTVRLDGDDYVLDAGRPSTDALALSYISDHAGCSGRELRRDLDVRDVEVVGALHRLERDHKIENRGRRGRQAWHRVESGTAVPRFPVVPGTGAGGVVPAPYKGGAEPPPQSASSENPPEPLHDVVDGTT